MAPADGTTSPSATPSDTFCQQELSCLGELYKAAVRLTRSECDAEDLVQEAVMRAWEFRSRSPVRTNSRAWMHRILQNCFITRYRKRLSEQTMLEAAQRELTIRGTACNPSLLPGEHFGDEVNAALQALPLPLRTVVLMVDLSELTYLEVAESLACPLGTVTSRLHRGRRTLQRRLRHLRTDQAPASGS